MTKQKKPQPRPAMGVFMSGRDVVKAHMPAVLKRYRKEAGLSQQKLADRLGMVKSYIAALELGYRAPNVQVLCNIACGVGVRPGEILDALVAEIENI